MHPIRMVVPPRTLTPDGSSSLQLRRTLPERRLASIGAWCLIDHFGDAHTPSDAMAPTTYPEAGIVSITWPVSGLVRRRDSIGTDALVRHGRLAMAVAGRGVATSEVGVEDPRGGRHARRFLHGLRLAAALPAEFRRVEPSFHEVGELPTVRTPAMRATILVGALAGSHADLRSPAATHTPLLAADITVTTGTQRLDLDEDFEHGVLLIDGHVAVNGTPLNPGSLGYLPRGVPFAEIATVTGGQLLLLGGPPWEDEFILFWRLLASDHDEIVQLREAWVSGDRRFGDVPGVTLREQAPAIPPVRLRPRRGSLRIAVRPTPA